MIFFPQTRDAFLAEAIHGCDFNTLALTGGITLAIPASLLDCGIRLFITTL